MSAQTVSMPTSLSVSEMSILQSLQAIYDQSTNEHAHRVMLLAEVVARELQLAEDEVFIICLAALLHDIGKVSVPDAILNKPGPLDEYEQWVVRLHPEIGQQMLLNAGGVFALLAPVVLTHHERWDGEGYPNRLSGEEIPLAARIIAVADSYDAMVQRRAYHEPRSAMEACAELQRCAGSQFDPRIVAIFLSSFAKSSELQECVRRNRAIGEAELAGVVCAMPSLQSDEYVRVSA
jgi:HD-GYP domain-containing protein (c-di-GMP phosphodiesterase class II)